MAELPTGGGLLALWWTVPPPRDAEFNRWYDEEHLADLTAVPGVLAGRRFRRAAEQVGAPGPHDYLTLYELGDRAVLDSDRYRALATNPSEWTRQVAFDLPMVRRVYDARPGAAGGPPGPEATIATGGAVLVVQGWADAEVLDEVHAWYDEDHLPAVCSAPGVLGGRRFVAADADWSDPGNRPLLTVYELESAAVATSDQMRDASAPTARRRALGDAVRFEVQVFEQVARSRAAG